MKNITIGIIIGTLTTITVLSVWQILSLRSEVQAQGSAIQQIVSFINQATKQSAPTK